MTGVIEALHIIEDNHKVLLSHTYTGRPLSASSLLPLYIAHPTPRPSLLYLPNTIPSTLLFNVKHDNLLFLLTTSSEIPPLQALEFLHRVIDVLEEFVGTPLLAQTIENNYEVIAQLLNEMCDAGTIATTEGNALRDLVEVDGFLGKLMSGIGLSGKPESSTPMQGISSLGSVSQPALPWRRSNVKHLSPRLYVDILETLSITFAPSSRPLTAIAAGSIAFTCEVSGTPDILLTLSTPSGRQNINSTMQLPVFHPCVRLQHWRQRPGELSFVPPDGRCVLAGYEVDLLPPDHLMSKQPSNLKLPVSLEVKTGLGPTGSEFEVRLILSPPLPTQGSSNSASSSLSSIRNSRVGGGSSGGPSFGGNSTPKSNLEGLRVSIPLPAEVRNLSEVRASRGDTKYAPGAETLEWVIPVKEAGSGTATLRATCIGHSDDVEEEDEADTFKFSLYDGADAGGYQTSGSPRKREVKEVPVEQERDMKKVARNKLFMPSSARVSFGIKGWLASGLRVEGLIIDQRKSRGVEGGMKLFKGVKYLTASRGGVEVRC